MAFSETINEFEAAQLLDIRTKNALQSELIRRFGGGDDALVLMGWLEKAARDFNIFVTDKCPAQLKDLQQRVLALLKNGTEESVKDAAELLFETFGAPYGFEVRVDRDKEERLAA